jgi:GDP-L-fucose synthase
MQRYSDEGIVNVGVGRDISILELAHRVADVVGYGGSIMTDPSKPDGTPRKVLDVGRINSLGWHADTALSDGIAATYKSFLSEHAA